MVVIEYFDELAQLPADQQQNEPALAPPDGVTPNFDDPGGKHAMGYSIIIICSVLATFSIIIRLYTRWLMKKFRVEDALFVSALGLYVGFQYTFYELARSPGLEVHQWDIPYRKLPRILFNFHIGSVLFGLATMCIKVAILYDWLRIFVARNQHNYIWWISQGLIWTNILFYGISTIIEIFQCQPRNKLWDPVVEGHCPIHMPVHNLVLALINLLSDFAIFALPQRVIWKLQMSTKKKIGVSLLFTIGIFACVCAIARLVYSLTVDNFDDTLHMISGLALWSNGEMTSGFLIMGIPAMPKVFKSLRSSDDPITTHIRTMTQGLKNQFSREETSHELSSWNKSRTRGGHPGPWESLDAEERVLVTVGAGQDPIELPPNAILMESDVTITYGVDNDAKAHMR